MIKEARTTQHVVLCFRADSETIRYVYNVTLVSNNEKGLNENV